MVSDSCGIGRNQSESHWVTATKPLAPVVESLIAEAAIPAKDTDRKSALLLLPDQFCPLLLARRTGLDSSHTSHYRTRPGSSARGVHEVITFFNITSVGTQVPPAQAGHRVMAVDYSPLSIRMLNSRGLDLTVTSEVDPPFAKGGHQMESNVIVVDHPSPLSIGVLSGVVADVTITSEVDPGSDNQNRNVRPKLNVGKWH